MYEMREKGVILFIDSTSYPTARKEEYMNRKPKRVLLRVSSLLMLLRGWNHLHLFNGNSNRGAGLCRETSSISLVSDTCLYPTGVGRYTVHPASLLCRAHIAATFSANPPVSVRRRLA